MEGLWRENGKTLVFVKCNHYLVKYVILKQMIMATFDFIKGITGKIGPVVHYVTKDGKLVIREHVIPHNPQTPKQQANRQKMGLVNKRLSPLAPFIKRGHPELYNAYRSVVGKACREAVVGKYPNLEFDYSKIQIASGNLPVPVDVQLQYDSEAGSVIFRWDLGSTETSQSINGIDKVYIVCFNADLPTEGLLMQPATRADGEATVEHPAEWDISNTHFWMYFSSPDLQQNSSSLYFKVG